MQAHPLREADVCPGNAHVLHLETRRNSPTLTRKNKVVSIPPRIRRCGDGTRRLTLSREVTTRRVNFSLCRTQLNSERPLLMGPLFCLAAAVVLSPYASKAGQDDTHASPFAVVHPLDFDEVQWTRGFWADRFDLCRQRMIPELWSIM